MGVTGADPGHGTDETTATTGTHEQGDERTDGRPSNAPPATPADTGRPDVVRDTTAGGGERTGEQSGDTVADEEQGAEPETEHAPGSDL